MNFDQAFHRLRGHEGAYVNHPKDPGGPTNWGVTERTARAHGYTGRMQDLPVQVAKDIYRKSYWAPVRADELPTVLRYAVFDAGVNSGPVRAIQWLQQAVRVADDGVLGPRTLAAVVAANPDIVLRRMVGARLRFMASLPNWDSFSEGWANRIADLLGD